VLNFVLAEDHLAPPSADSHASVSVDMFFLSSSDGLVRVRFHVRFSAARGDGAGMVQSTRGKLYILDRDRRMQERGGQL
jgi:hypothetical protein